MPYPGGVRRVRCALNANGARGNSGCAVRGMVDAATTGGVSAGMGSKEGERPMNTHGRRAWPAAKYLTYGFWRSWILIVYTAPIWSYLTHAPVAGVPSSQMYVWSTLAFSVVSIALGVLHRAGQRWLSNRWVLLAAGMLAA